MTIRHVRQLDNHGCGVACLAMLTGLTYAEARQLWPNRNFRSNGGLSRSALDSMLARLGYAVCRRVDTRIPFGQAHLVEVQSQSQKDKGRGFHFVVMDADGVVYDPDEPADKTFTLDDYEVVRAIAAVVRVNPEEVHEVTI